jgi:hypothetical protein
MQVPTTALLLLQLLLVLELHSLGKLLLDLSLVQQAQIHSQLDLQLLMSLSLELLMVELAQIL